MKIAYKFKNSLGRIYSKYKPKKPNIESSGCPKFYTG